MAVFTSPPKVCKQAKIDHLVGLGTIPHSYLPKKFYLVRWGNSGKQL